MWAELTVLSCGCSFHDVNAESLRKDDSPVDSAVFSKTLRYFWLLFAPIDTLSLDDYVFSVSTFASLLVRHPVSCTR